MTIYNELELIGKGYIEVSDYLEEKELEEGKEYRIVGWGILQRGWCNRNLKYPSGYDKWFDFYNEAIEYEKAIIDCGYGNTISSPIPLFIEVKPN